VKNTVTRGHGEQYGTTCEGAYIVVEMAQMPAGVYQTIELRHGPIVLCCSAQHGLSRCALHSWESVAIGDSAELSVNQIPTRAPQRLLT
jgi:hypothetical protein